MSGPWRLSLGHAWHHRGRSALIVACLALALWLPAATRTLFARYRDELGARAAATPLVVGSRGNRFDLVLSALYFRASRMQPVPRSLAGELAADDVLVVPLHARFTARRRPLVGVAHEYFERRGLEAERGHLPLVVGDAVLGARVAADLGLGPGTTLTTDPVELYDIARPAALEMNVVGVLAPRGTPDDEAVFVDVKTTWAVEGYLHGHDDVREPGSLPEGFELARTEDAVAVSPALIEHQRVTPENARDFHLHGDEGALPLSALLVFPASAKAGTLLKARVNEAGEWQAVVPGTVVDDLVAFVFRVKGFLDRVSVLVAISTALFTGLVLLLSARLRQEEFRTLHAMGCGRRTVLEIAVVEVALLVAASVVLALGGVAATLRWLPDLVRTL